MIPAKKWALALGLMMVAVAACGGDDDDSGAANTDAGDGSSDDSSSDGTSTPTSGDGGAVVGGSADGTSSDEPACDATVPGSEITVNVYASTGQLDPTRIAGGVVGGTEIAAIYDELFMYDYEKNEVVPHLAKGITSNKDFTKFTLTLRDGITFSDGTPLDAQMVSDNIDRYFTKDATAPHRAFLSMIEDKQVVNPTTLELTMKQPWAEFPSFLTEQPGMIVNTNAVGNDISAFANKPPEAAGVGPYILERNAPGEEIVFKARDDYWGGPVCVETLRVVAIPGGTQTYDAFKNGELDVAFLRDPVTVAATQEDGVQGMFIPVDIGLMMMINHGDGYVGADPRLREAIWHAMDPEALNERAYQGTMNMSMSLISPESTWGSDDLATVEYDPERAKQLVEEAKADGVEAKLHILSNTIPPAPDAALAWQGMLEAVGFEVTTSTKPVNEVVADMLSINYDTMNTALSIEPAQITTRLYGALHSTGENNRWQYKSDEMDAALVEAMGASAEQRAAALTKVNDIYVKDYVGPIYGNNLDGIIWQDDVSGVVVNPTDIYLFHDASVEG